MTWDEVLTGLPLIAILHGIDPDAAAGVGEALHEGGVRCVEVPIDGPEALESLRRLSQALDGQALVGAGAVLTVAQVQAAAAAGAQLITAPNADPEVVRAAKRLGLTALPAFLTPTEGLAALAAGADGLRLFPAEATSPQALKALRAVLPAATPVLPVGGIEPDHVTAWRGAGATGFGLDSCIYVAGHTAAECRERALRFIEAWKSHPVH